jgi:hypothetical protein
MKRMVGGTYVDPPTDTKATDKVTDEYSEDTIDSPVMSDAHMAEIMSGK